MTIDSSLRRVCAEISNCKGSSSSVPLAAIERIGRPEDAVQAAQNFLQMRRIRWSVRSVGSPLSTTHCDLFSKDGQLLARGAGKGTGIQSLASGLFEAIEHLFTAKEPAHMPVMTLDLSGVDEALAMSSPQFALYTAHSELSFSRVWMRSLTHSERRIAYPYFLSDPDFHPTNSKEQHSIKTFSLSRYSTNSGIAAGRNEGEAILHGILELIERDAVGATYLKTVFATEPVAMRRIALHNVSTNLQGLDKSVADMGFELTVWDITSEFKVPVILAKITRNDGDAFFGSGCSLSFDYALERAVLEAFQGAHATELGFRPPQLTRLQQEGRRLSNYVRCYTLRGLFVFRGGEVLVSRADCLPPSREKVTIETQVRDLLETLNRFGIEIFHRSLLEDSVHVHQVYAPMLERFHLVGYGVRVAPGYRGSQILAATAREHAAPSIL